MNKGSRKVRKQISADQRMSRGGNRTRNVLQQADLHPLCHRGHQMFPLIKFQFLTLQVTFSYCTLGIEDKICYLFFFVSLRTKVATAITVATRQPCVSDLYRIKRRKSQKYYFSHRSSWHWVPLLSWVRPGTGAHNATGRNETTW